MKPTTRFRQRLQQDRIVVIPGAYDALMARVVERVGFEAVYMTGAGISNAMVGVPDINLVTMTEMVTAASYMAEAVSLPVICDADTGYGHAVNVMRTVREFEQAGVAGIHIEDQVAPKRCGHLAGKQVIPQEEMLGKIQAAVEARRDPDFVLIARVDARGVTGFRDAIERGIAYREAGADVIFPEALETQEEFAEYVREVGGPLLANMTEFGKSPYLRASELEALGYRMVIFPVSSMRVALKAAWDFYEELKATGTQAGWLDRMKTRGELYDLIDYSRYQEYEDRFTGAPSSDSAGWRSKP